MSAIPATWEAAIRRIVVQDQPGQIVSKTLFRKYPTHKRAGAMTQVRGYEILSSNPNTAQIKIAWVLILNSNWLGIII
jgi:hypothetical protein